MAALSTIAAISALAASAFSAGSALTQKSPGAPSTPAVPKAPTVDLTVLQGAAASRSGKAAIPGTPDGRSSTLLTGPSGAVAPAAVERKTLLGA